MVLPNAFCLDTSCVNRRKRHITNKNDIWASPFFCSWPQQSLYENIYFKKLNVLFAIWAGILMYDDDPQKGMFFTTICTELASRLIQSITYINVHKNNRALKRLCLGDPTWSFCHYLNKIKLNSNMFWSQVPDC